MDGDERKHPKKIALSLPQNGAATKSLSDQMYDIILGRILDRKYRPGERLLSGDLRAEFGVSSTPVRDALHRLRQAGFVDVRAREGVYVSRLDAKRASDIYDVRIALEVLATRNAAIRIPTSEIEDLGRRYREADEILARTGDARVMEDMDFALHELVLRHSDNASLQQTLANIHKHHAWVWTTAGRGAGMLRWSFEDHKALLEILARRDPDAAANAMGSHLQTTKSALVAYFTSLEASQQTSVSIEHYLFARSL